MPASTSKYLSSDTVKRMNSAKPLNAKKETGATVGSGEPISTKASDSMNKNIAGGAGPKLTGNAPLRKIAPDQFFKGATHNGQHTPNQAQSTNVRL